MATRPDGEAALSFLKKFTPGGPWVLTAIQVDRKGIETKAFRDKEELATWLAVWNGERNIYFNVNPTLQDMDKKAEREDIKTLDWLHVDVDPRAGEPIQAEQNRIKKLFGKKLPEGVPEPSCVIFSGGGYQAFWRLETPLPIDGQLPKAEDAKLYNLRLEQLFDGDQCHNIDRIMRLPGTVNLPDAKKIEKGRVAQTAKVVSFSNTAYPIDAFTKAVSVQDSVNTGFSGGALDISSSGERIEDLAELDVWAVPDRIKVIVAQGCLHDEPKTGDNSRSAWLFDACCGLARSGVPDEVIFSLITDPGWLISESVLSMRTNAHKYAIRQIERAKEFVIDPHLERLNSRFAVIENIGGKCRIMEEVLDETLNRHRLTLQSFEDFRNRFMHIPIKVGRDAKGVPKFVGLGSWWLKKSKRRMFQAIVFAPGRDLPNVYNLWKGFGCESLPGDCGLLLEHIRKNICKGDVEHFDYLMGWMARLIQKPSSQGEVAVVLRGGGGTGKTFFAEQLGSLLGRHFLSISDASHLTGRFNAHMRDLVLMFADEAFFAGDKKHISVLKTIITGGMLTVEKKYVDVEPAANYLHLIMASNDMHVIPACDDERRYFVVDVSEEYQQNSPYFRKIAKQMDNGGREALLHTLMNYDISEFNVREVPNTAALHEQKMLSLNPNQEWWYQKLLDGNLLRNAEGWPEEVIKDDLVDDYTEHLRRFNVPHRGSQTSLGRFLMKMFPDLAHTRKVVEIDIPVGDGYTRKKSVRKGHYVMPSLEDARSAWDEAYKHKEPWPD